MFKNLSIRSCISIFFLVYHVFSLALNVFQLGLAWQPALKKTEKKLELLTDIDMLLVAEKGIKGGIVI